MDFWNKSDLKKRGIFGAGVPRFGAYTIYDKISFGYYAAYDNIQSITFGQKYNLEYTTTKGNQSAKLDGVTIWTATGSNDLNDAYTIALSCRNQSRVEWIQKTRLYDFRFYDNSALIQDLIPVSSPKGNCMFDRVNEKLFCNQATSGPDFLTD